MNEVGDARFVLGILQFYSDGYLEARSRVEEIISLTEGRQGEGSWVERKSLRKEGSRRGKEEETSS